VKVLSDSARIFITELSSLQFKREFVNNHDEFNTITRKVLRERRREVEFEVNQRRRKTTTKHLPEA
jgi:hypothetical protein